MVDVPQRVLPQGQHAAHHALRGLRPPAVAAPPRAAGGGGGVRGCGLARGQRAPLLLRPVLLLSASPKPFPAHSGEDLDFDPTTDARAVARHALLNRSLYPPAAAPPGFKPAVSGSGTARPVGGGKTGKDDEPAKSKEALQWQQQLQQGQGRTLSSHRRPGPSSVSSKQDAEADSDSVVDLDSESRSAASGRGSKLSRNGPASRAGAADSDDDAAGGKPGKAKDQRAAKQQQQQGRKVAVSDASGDEADAEDDDAGGSDAAASRTAGATLHRPLGGFGPRDNGVAAGAQPSALGQGRLLGLPSRPLQLLRPAPPAPQLLLVPLPLPLTLLLGVAAARRLPRSSPSLCPIRSPPPLRLARS